MTLVLFDARAYGCLYLQLGTVTPSNCCERMSLNFGIGQILKKIRIRRGVPPITAAVRLRVSVERMLDYEAGLCGIPASDIYELAKLYDADGEIEDAILNLTLKFRWR